MSSNDSGPSGNSDLDYQNVDDCFKDFYTEVNSLYTTLYEHFHVA